MSLYHGISRIVLPSFGFFFSSPFVHYFTSFIDSFFPFSAHYLSFEGFQFIYRMHLLVSLILFLHLLFARSNCFDMIIIMNKLATVRKWFNALSLLCFRKWLTIHTQEREREKKNSDGLIMTMNMPRDYHFLVIVAFSLFISPNYIRIKTLKTTKSFHNWTEWYSNEVSLFFVYIFLSLGLSKK